MTEVLETIREAPAPPKRLQTTMAIWEQIELKKLINKYGWEDYESMARDIAINKMQKTPKQLKKRIALYKRLLAL